MATHHQVASAWANDTGKHFKGHSMFHEGQSIYSYGYHFEIARIVLKVGEGMGRITLHTDRGYSVSTQKQKGIVYSAARRAGFRIFTVPHLDTSATSHEWNWRHYLALANQSLDKARRARTYKSFHFDEAQRMVDEANAYRDAFALTYQDATLLIAKALKFDVIPA